MGTFVKQAEQRIYNSIQFSYLRKNVTGTLTTNNKYLSAPADFLSVYSMAVVKANGEYQYLINKDVNFIREVYPSPTSTGLPKYYGIFGPTVVTSTITDELSFIVGPTPDSGYAIELHYYYYPESIVDAGTSWLGDNVDSVLLYGALVEAYTFLKGEQDLVALYDTKYKEALMLAKQLGDGKQRGDMYRDGQVKYPVK
jgi:CTP:phosphocholine cytidylyltransferase-like protein